MINRIDKNSGIYYQVRMMFNFGTDKGPSKAGSERFKRYHAAALKAGFTNRRDVQKWMRQVLDAEAARLLD